MAKGYKLYAPSQIFYFNEEDGKGFEPKAHVSTIDKFTTQYSNQQELVDAFTKSSINNGVRISFPFGIISIPEGKKILLTHNHNGKIDEEPLYSKYKGIANMPLIDKVTCDTESEKFIQLYRNFKQLIQNCPEFYNYIMNDGYYTEQIKYLLRTPDKINLNWFSAYFKGYTSARKSYKDIKNFYYKLNR